MTAAIKEMLNSSDQKIKEKGISLACDFHNKVFQHQTEGWRLGQDAVDKAMRHQERMRSADETVEPWMQAAAQEAREKQA